MLDAVYFNWQRYLIAGFEALIKIDLMMRQHTKPIRLLTTTSASALKCERLGNRKLNAGKQEIVRVKTKLLNWQIEKRHERISYKLRTTTLNTGWIWWWCLCLCVASESERERHGTSIRDHQTINECTFSSSRDEAVNSSKRQNVKWWKPKMAFRTRKICLEKRMKKRKK